MENPYPEFFARFYDILYSHLRGSEEYEYYLSQILHTQGPVLEIGVGTGRIFRDAILSKPDIHGIDISPSMLDVLRSHLRNQDKEKISLQDALHFSFPWKFELIIAPFRMFMHLEKKQEQLQALRNIRDHLKDGGRFIFDVFVPDMSLLANPLQDVLDFDGEYEKGRMLQRYVSTRPDLIHQIIHVTFLLKWDESGSQQQASWEVPMRFFFRYELEHLIERAGFSQYEILGDYSGQPLQSDSKEFIPVCYK